MLNLLLNVLRFKLGSSAFLVHDIDGLLFAPSLPIDVLELTTETLRHLSLSTDHPLKLLILHHLIGGGSTKVCHLRMELTFKVVQSDILVLLFLVPLV